MAFWICNGRAASGDDHSSSHHPGPEGRAIGRAGRLEAITCPTLAFFSVNAGQSRVTTAPCVTVSQVSATDIATDFGVLPSVIRVVPNGVDTSLFRPLPQIRRDPQQIVATASADTFKGLHVLRAFKQLREERPQQRLVLIARPKPGGDTEALIRQLDLADCIRFVGDASHDDINRLYAESAVAVVPSLYEGFGLPRLRRWRRASRWCLATAERLSGVGWGTAGVGRRSRRAGGGHRARVG